MGMMSEASIDFYNAWLSLRENEEGEVELVTAENIANFLGNRYSKGLIQEWLDSCGYEDYSGEE